MATQTFAWAPQAGFTVTREPNVTVVKFGDGYEQRQVNGLNPLLDKYELQFKGVDGACRRINTAKLAEGFLKARNAVEAFLWTPPGETTARLFVCRSWTMTKTHQLYELSATFEQVPM